MSGSRNEWILDLTTEAAILLPFYLNERDPAVRQAVWQFIDRLIESPVGRGVEERPGVYSAHVGRTGVVVVWTLNLRDRAVVLAIVDREAPGP